MIYLFEYFNEFKIIIDAIEAVIIHDLLLCNNSLYVFLCISAPNNVLLQVAYQNIKLRYEICEGIYTISLK